LTPAEYRGLDPAGKLRAMYRLLDDIEDVSLADNVLDGDLGPRGRLDGVMLDWDWYRARRAEVAAELEGLGCWVPSYGRLSHPWGLRVMIREDQRLRLRIRAIDALRAIEHT
jgi:hypothetical protein